MSADLVRPHCPESGGNIRVIDVLAPEVIQVTNSSGNMQLNAAITSVIKLIYAHKSRGKRSDKLPRRTKPGKK